LINRFENHLLRRKNTVLDWLGADGECFFALALGSRRAYGFGLFGFDIN
jgi:hypothetical protein